MKLLGHVLCNHTESTENRSSVHKFLAQGRTGTSRSTMASTQTQKGTFAVKVRPTCAALRGLRAVRCVPVRA